ncbi:ribA/ribD-fused uncharacterized protein [Paenibacillus sp. DS2363]|uniref:NADAR family protein n=1 Tax=unclassified Paenibacillus TaxID=185978 RepID=UPI0030F8AEFD
MTRIYSRDRAIVFKKTNEEFGGLSNMSPGYPLEINRIKIRTSEALYQACRFPHNIEVQRLIISERSPMTAKMRSKPFKSETRKDWDDIRLLIMRWCLRAKLLQNWDKFHELLISTGDLPIVEESNRDSFWGAKPDEDGRLTGTNSLGRLLMELREETKTYDYTKYNLNPPQVSDFFLMGEKIPVISATLFKSKSVDNVKKKTEIVEDSQLDMFDL